MIDLHLIKRAMKHWFQRRIRGWDDSETWNLDRTFAKLILPRLRRYRQITVCHPDHMTMEDYLHDLDLMIIGFAIIADISWFEQRPDDRECVQKTLDLFAKHYQSLWW